MPAETMILRRAAAAGQRRAMGTSGGGRAQGGQEIRGVPRVEDVVRAQPAAPGLVDTVAETVEVVDGMTVRGDHEAHALLAGGVDEDVGQVETVGLAVDL